MKIYLKDGKIATCPSGKIITYVPDYTSVIFYNANAVKDDGFNVFLNDEFIGFCNNNTDESTNTALRIVSDMQKAVDYNFRLEFVVANGQGSLGTVFLKRIDGITQYVALYTCSVFNQLQTFSYQRTCH